MSRRRLPSAVTAATVVLTALAGAIILLRPAHAQPATADAPAAAAAATSAGAAPGDAPRATFSVGLNQDNFFGFYPTFSGTYARTRDARVEFAFYGTLWTIPAFNVGAAPSGGNLWTEFGVGARVRTAGDRLFVKPQLGITNGSLLSGAPAGGRANVLDGIVPSVTLNWVDARIEGETYVGYYRAARAVGPVQLDFLHGWGSAGVRFARIASVGAHYEHLRNTRTTATGGAPSDTYRWLGGYVQFALPVQGATARLTAGDNVLGGAQGNFYKLAVGASF